MNTLGVVLSVICLLVALAELRTRSDPAGRRMAAMLAVAAWASMACVAWDYYRMYTALKAAQHVAVW